MSLRIRLMKLFGIKQKPEVGVFFGEHSAMSEYVIKARGGPHGYEWEQITINSHHNSTKFADIRAKEYAQEIGGTFVCE